MLPAPLYFSNVCWNTKCLVFGLILIAQKHAKKKKTRKTRTTIPRLLSFAREIHFRLQFLRLLPRAVCNFHTQKKERRKTGSVSTGYYSADTFEETLDVPGPWSNQASPKPRWRPLGDVVPFASTTRLFHVRVFFCLDSGNAATRYMHEAPELVTLYWCLSVTVSLPGHSLGASDVAVTNETMSLTLLRCRRKQEICLHFLMKFWFR